MKITSCRIDKSKMPHEVVVASETQIGCFFPDELSFSEEEFIGLEFEEARELIHKRTVAYIQS